MDGSYSEGHNCEHKENSVDDIYTGVKEDTINHY